MREYRRGNCRLFLAQSSCVIPNHRRFNYYIKQRLFNILLLMHTTQRKLGSSQTNPNDDAQSKLFKFAFPIENPF